MSEDKLIEVMARAIGHVGYLEDGFDSEPHHYKTLLLLQATAALNAYRDAMGDDAK